MLVAGCDIGSTTGKAVVLNETEVLARFVMPATTRPEETARIAMNEAVKAAGLSAVDELRYVVGTGYGRLKVAFANENVSEITCHARGAHWLNAAVRTVVDIGGQDCKVISIDDRGRVREFAMNDRCAAGTGRFFEAMARVLQCGLDGISALENQGDNAATISSQCSVFAESEVVTLINEGTDLSNIIAGINNAVANRLFAMVRRVGLAKELVLTGGCSKNAGLAKALQTKLGVEVTSLPEDPQIAGAVGAALLAREKAAQKAAVA